MACRKGHSKYRDAYKFIYLLLCEGVLIIITKFKFLSLSGFYFSSRYCWENAIGLETGEVSDTNITASSYIVSNPPSSARLGLHVGWCPKNVINAFLQIDLGVPYRLPAVATQGRSDGSFVKRYALTLSLDGGNWTAFEKVECS